MAGVKGRSGGSRPGSGAKPRPPVLYEGRDPLAFLLDVMQGTREASPTQLKAAITAAQYVNVRTHDGGKKDGQLAAAERVAEGRFAPLAPPPKLVVNNK